MVNINNANNTKERNNLKRIKKVNSILVSQPKPKDENSPLFRTS